MNNAIFVWIKDIKISGSLPTANCEFISNYKTMHAITSAENPILVSAALKPASTAAAAAI